MKFLRSSTRRFLRLGRKSNKKLKWRRARGRHSKIREKIRGKPARITIGFRKPRSERNKINNKIPIIIKNLKGLESATKEKNIIIIASVGGKKKKEIIENANKKGIEILNIRKEK